MYTILGIFHNDFIPSAAALGKYGIGGHSQISIYRAKYFNNFNNVILFFAGITSN